ncbi:hypothetical protein DSM112329_05309 [Paraconexibacter sp. AEG42_29]|uniref:L,D-TPase catalytic domain-containing protein n=1 Tax=Paraconexibacter sp. AEG42_29 TaxID=2997339 RepID=A0AAU7B375_9ACTN
MTPRRLLPLAFVPALLAPAAAGAQLPGVPPAPTTPTTPAPASPPAKPAVVQKKAKIVVVAERVGKRATVLTGSSIRLRGTVTPYVPGQKVTVRIDQAGKSVMSVSRTIQKMGNGQAGRFLIAYKPKSAGTLHVNASHLTTPAQASARAKQVAVDVLPRAVPQGSQGRKVRILQSRLKALKYVVDVNGRMDGHTIRAVVAFRKLTGMSRIASADKPFFQKMAAGGGGFKVKFPNHGRHIEGDITHQVLALIGKGGKVERIYPTSSGAPSTPTILGTFRVYRKDFGTNAKGMVHSSYFIRGYAIHGYSSVPTYNASHGCLRVPVPDAKSIFDWVDHGTIVDTYYR